MDIELTKMAVKFKVKVGEVGNSLRVTIPKELAEHIQTKKGDTLIIYADNSHLVLEKEKKN